MLGKLEAGQSVMADGDAGGEKGKSDTTPVASKSFKVI